jgi:hypothetical protein
MNYIQVDAFKITTICRDKIYSVFQMPFYFIVPAAYLFYYLRLSFFAAIGVMIIGMLVNFFVGVLQSKAWNMLLIEKDKRMNITTQTINSVKLIKIYAWTQKFLERIIKARKDETDKAWKALVTLAFFLLTLYIFPLLMNDTLFAVYLANGGQLNLSSGYTIIIFFNLISVT